MQLREILATNADLARLLDELQGKLKHSKSAITLGSQTPLHRLTADLEPTK